MEEVINFVGCLCQHFKAKNQNNIANEIADLLFQAYPEQMDDYLAKLEPYK